LDVLNQFRAYDKLEVQIDGPLNEGDGEEVKQKKFVEKKINEIKLDDYLKHIRTNCKKNECTDVMFEALKNLQYF
jgi:hypothetical protein